MAKAKVKENEEKEQGKEKNKEKGINLVLLIPILLVIVVGGTIGGTLVTNHFLVKDKEVVTETKTKVKGIDTDESIVSLEEFLVNLEKEEGHEQQYMKVNLSILVDNEEKSEEVTKNVAVIRDSVVNLLRQKKASDILSSAESVPNLKKELKAAINHEYGSSIVNEVYVTDLVIQ
jgi:flagellar FliL protein